MKLCRVLGTVVATVKHPAFAGRKLLVVQPLDERGADSGSSFIAVDMVQAGKAVYELDEGKHHDHLVCLDCGRVVEFYDPEIEARQRAAASSRGFELQEHSLALYASCTRTDCEHRRK